jgi:glucokinase
LVPRLGEFFFASEFRKRFEHKGRFSTYLQDIPTVLITDTLAALHGVSAAMATRS